MKENKFHFTLHFLLICLALLINIGRVNNLESANLHIEGPEQSGNVAPKNQETSAKGIFVQEKKIQVPLKTSEAKETVIVEDKNASLPDEQKLNKTSSKGSINYRNITSVIKPLGDDMQAGALLRGFYVFLGLSLILVIYFFIKSYRLRKGSQPSQHVRKYGVRAHRGDVEILPLPLEDDDDDDTVFELNTSNRS